MAVDRTPVLKRCRSLALDPVYLGIDKKSNRNAHRSNRKLSEYGVQLQEKQKVRFMYGLNEKQFAKTFKRATKMAGITGENLLQLLETRLDNVVYRMGLATTRRAARQVVNHGHITVNGIKVDIPSYTVKPGDVIAVKEQSLDHPAIKAAVEATLNRPAYVEFDANKLTGKYLRFPDRSELNPDINEALIVEYYNR